MDDICVFEKLDMQGSGTSTNPTWLVTNNEHVGVSRTFFNTHRPRVSAGRFLG